MSLDKPLIMIVDDSKTILDTAKRFLEPQYTVVTANDGFAAMAKLFEIKPDLVFLDVMMPRLDGYNTCLAMRSNPDFQKVPVVMLSSKDGPFDKARGAMMGCNDYLTKPFSKDAILQSIVNNLKLDNSDELHESHDESDNKINTEIDNHEDSGESD